VKMSGANSVTKNRLLLALPRREFDRLKPQLEHVKCESKKVLVDADGSLAHVYFPDSGVISVVAVYADGNTIEMATVGREGATGFQEFFGGRASSARLLVQIPGAAHCLPRSAFQRSLKELTAFRALMSAYVHALLEQVMLSAACNGAHSAQQRLARWLLMMRDRQDEDDLLITQDVMAEMLGVYRPTVTKTARVLQKAGAIELRRKVVRIKSRDRLLAASCECYQLARTRTAQHLPKTYTEHS
jgi:CRP-like cAMP-binding protein